MKESLNSSKMIKLKPNWTTRRIHVSKHVILNLRIGLFDNQFGNINSFAPSQDFIPTFNEGIIKKRRALDGTCLQSEISPI